MSLTCRPFAVQPDAPRLSPPTPRKNDYLWGFSRMPSPKPPMGADAAKSRTLDEEALRIAAKRRKGAASPKQQKRGESNRLSSSSAKKKLPTMLPPLPFAREKKRALKGEWRMSDQLEWCNSPKSDASCSEAEGDDHDDDDSSDGEQKRERIKRCHSFSKQEAEAERQRKETNHARLFRSKSQTENNAKQTKRKRGKWRLGSIFAGGSPNAAGAAGGATKGDTIVRKRDNAGGAKKGDDAVFGEVLKGLKLV